MYNEKKDGFSIKNVVIQFLFVALFIFLLIWLFPMKSDFKNAMDKLNKNQTDMSVFYDRIFNENILAMKDSAKDYFTTPRLPQKIGETVKITLGDMLEKKIILPFVDSKGKQCDLVSSYVEVTKDQDEFVMKVNLRCTNEENYLLVHMGCYDYCQTAICETNQTDVKKPVIYSPVTNQPIIINPSPPNINITINNNNTNNNTNNNNNNNNGGGTVTPDTPDVPTPEPGESLWEYVKTNEGRWVETDWSIYTTTPVTADKYTAVRTKTTTQKVLKGYNVKTVTDKSKPLFSVKNINTGTETILVCNKYDYVQSGTTVGNQWVDNGIVYLNDVPTDTTSVHYEYINTTDRDCTSCSSQVLLMYRKYSRSTVDLSKYTCVDSSYKTIQLSTQVKTITGYETTTTKEPVYEEKVVKTYSYKKRSYVEGTKDIKWSKYNDVNLLNQGYKYTGNCNGSCKKG